MRRNFNENLHAIALFVLLLLCYAYIFPRWSDPNQNSRLDMVFAVVEDGTFQIDSYVSNTVDYAKVGEHYYSDKAPGAAFLGIPLYAGLRVLLDTPLLEGVTNRIARSAAFASTLRTAGSGVSAQKVRFALAQVLLSLIVSALPTAVLGVLMYWLLARVTPQVWPRLAVVLGYGLLTPAFPYANAFYGHQLAAVLLFAAFYLIVMAPAPVGAGRLIAVGVLLAYSVVAEYPAALMAGVIFLYAAYTLLRQHQWLRIGWVVVSGLVVAAGWMMYNNTVFGGPLELGYSHSELWADQHQTGFMSLRLPTVDALWGITFSPFRGLFLLAPWLLLALPGALLWWRGRQMRAELVTILACVGAMFFFNTSSGMWWGGFAVGPRYVLPMLPFLALLVTPSLVVWGNQFWMRVALGGLFMWSAIAVWGLTLADQAYPSDSIYNPLFEYALPNWQAGNIARNVGTLLGLQGAASLIPLAGMLLLVGALWYWLARRTAGANPRPIAALDVTTDKTTHS